MRSLHTSWNHIRRSPYQAMAAIFIMAQTFFVISIFTFIIFGSAKIITYFESIPQVRAFFKSDVTEENIAALDDQVKATGKVSVTKFVSQKEALQIYRREFKNDPLLLEFVTSDILPPSIEISTHKIEDLESISNVLRNSPFVDDVQFPKDIVSNLTRWTNALRKLGIALVGVLALDSVFLMVIIIGIKISQKKDEIEIMRLLSATKWYVRWPFIYEGMFYGVMGAFFGWALASAALIFATPFLSSFLGAIPILPVSFVFLPVLLAVEFLIAILLGSFSSFLAVLRYLK